MDRDQDRSPAEEEYILAVTTGPLTDVIVTEAVDGDHVDLAIDAVSVDPDTGDAVPVSIALNPDDSALIVTVAGEETVVPLVETAEESSSRNAGGIGPLRRLHELATRVEQEAKGKARQLSEKFRRSHRTGEGAAEQGPTGGTETT
jgi:hypothetical protein